MRLALGLLAVVPTITTAAELPPIAFVSALGFHELRADEMSGPAGPIALSADVTGDGRTDELRILINGQRDEAVVVAVAETAGKVDTYVLNQTSAAVGRTLRLGIVTVNGRAAVRIMRPDGATLTVRYDGEEFRTEASASSTIL